MTTEVHYRTVKIQGLDIFYREAGPSDAPAILPPTLIVWGKGDPVFSQAGAEAYRKDLKDVEMHLLDAGHFALETHSVEIASHIRRFLREKARP